MAAGGKKGRSDPRSLSGWGRSSAKAREHLATIAPTADWYPASLFFQGMKFMVFGDPAPRRPGPAR
jgi:hypothetical protein